MPYLLLLFLSAPAWAAPPFDGNTLVDIKKMDFTILVDMRFATPDNVTKKAWYPASRCFLRARVASRLVKIQTAMKLQNRGLKLLDCYVPSSIEAKLSEALPQKHGGHSKGASIDVVLVETGVDYPSLTAHGRREVAPPDPKIEARFVRALDAALKKEGFVKEASGWSHYEHRDEALYLSEDIPFETLK